MGISGLAPQRSSHPMAKEFRYHSQGLLVTLVGITYRRELEQSPFSEPAH